jgi:hypothetical protein
MPWDSEYPEWYLHVPGVQYGYKYILEPRFSQSVLRAQINEHAMLDSLTAGYECAVAAAALGVHVEDLPSALGKGETPITSSGNLLGRKHEFTAVASTPYGAIRAVEYSEKECGMSEECVIALEGHYLDLQYDDNQYERYISQKYTYEVMGKHPCESGIGWLVQTFGANDTDGFTNLEEFFEQNINEETYSIDFVVGWHVDLLALPCNAEAATHYGQPMDPQRFVEELEAVDVSTIPAQDMKCMQCWGDFDEAQDDVIELKNGKVQADNSPVKMPCPHGHLIGKTCLMQLIDAEIRLCPMCRFEIAPPKGDPRGSFETSFLFGASQDYSVWD